MAFGHLDHYKQKDISQIFNDEPVIYSLLLNLEYNNIINVCKTINTKNMRKVCDDDYF